MYSLLLAKLFLIGFIYVMGLLKKQYFIVNVANNVIVMNTKQFRINLDVNCESKPVPCPNWKILLLHKYHIPCPR